MSKSVRIFGASLGISKAVSACLHDSFQLTRWFNKKLAKLFIYKCHIHLMPNHVILKLNSQIFREFNQKYDSNTP